MRRSGMSTAMAILLLALPAWPQMRGAHASGARPSGAGRGPSMSARMNGRVGGVFGHGSTHGGFGRPGAFPFHHHHFFNRRFGWGYPWAYAYYPGWYWDYPPDYSDYDRSENQDQQLQAYQAQQMDNQQQIEQRLEQLEERLDRLYEDRSAPQPQAQPQPQSKSDTSRAAVLVYKDGHSLEVRNYAIVGQTIWILNEQQAKKVPFSALDLKATRKANEDRDVEFAVPGSSS
jgi:hypothetical protein